MTGIRVQLDNPALYDSPRAYVEQHLAPAVTELHRLINELLSPGCSSSEEWAVDMVSTGPFASGFQPLDGLLQRAPKHVTFDGTEYFSLPKELLRSKQVKVQFTAVVYGKPLGKSCGPVAFRLVRGDGMVVDNSEFQVTTEEPETVSRTLSFGDQRGSISPELRDYIIEGMCVGGRTLPVCRRLSLSFVYI